MTSDGIWDTFKQLEPELRIRRTVVTTLEENLRDATVFCEDYHMKKVGIKY